MKPNDVHLWEKFIRQNPNFCESVDYDYPVGEAPSWMDTENNEAHAAQAINYRKKIDAVCYWPQRILLCEVKPYAETRGLGQILTYKIEYVRQEQPTLDVGMAIITNECKANYKEIFETHGVQVFEVGTCSQCASFSSL